MSTTKTVERTVDAPLDEGQLLAHYGTWPPRTPAVALCGKALLGVPAPPGHPFCVVCAQLWKEGLA
jgi:hypothetical protein